MGEQYTVNVAPEVAVRAQQVASRTHRRLEDVLSEWLNHVSSEASVQSLAHTEAELLQNINLGFSEREWARYHTLVAKRRAETLTQKEHAELITLSEQLEQANARRIANLIELAKLRNTSLESLMRDLGITTPAYV